MQPEYTARHTRQIITPARTGGRIGQNRRTYHPVERYRLAIYLLSIVTTSAVIGLVAAAFLQH